MLDILNRQILKHPSGILLCRTLWRDKSLRKRAAPKKGVDEEEKTPIRKSFESWVQWSQNKMTYLYFPQAKTITIQPLEIELGHDDTSTEIDEFLKIHGFRPIAQQAWPLTELMFGLDLSEGRIPQLKKEQFQNKTFFIAPQPATDILKRLVRMAEGSVTLERETADYIIGANGSQSENQKMIVPEDFVYTFYPNYDHVIEMLLEIVIGSPRFVMRKWALERLVARSDDPNQKNIIEWLLLHGHGGLVAGLYELLARKNDKRFVEIALMHADRLKEEKKDGITDLGEEEDEEDWENEYEEEWEDEDEEETEDVEDDEGERDWIEFDEKMVDRYYRYEQEQISYNKKLKLEDPELVYRMGVQAFAQWYLEAAGEEDTWQVLPSEKSELLLKIPQLPENPELNEEFLTWTTEFTKFVVENHTILDVINPTIAQLDPTLQMIVAKTLYKTIGVWSRLKERWRLLKRLFKQTKILLCPGLFGLTVAEFLTGFGYTKTRGYLRKSVTQFLEWLATYETPSACADHVLAILINGVSPQDDTIAPYVSILTQFPQKIWFLLQQSHEDITVQTALNLFEHPNCRAFIAELSIQEMIEILRIHVEDHLPMLNRWAYKLLKKKVLVHPVDKDACEIMIRTSEEFGLLAIEWLKTQDYIWTPAIAALAILHSSQKVHTIGQEYLNTHSQIAAETFLESARLFVSEPQWEDESFKRLEMLAGQVSVDPNEVCLILLDTDREIVTTFVVNLLPQASLDAWSKATNSSLADVRKRATEILIQKAMDVTPNDFYPIAYQLAVMSASEHENVAQDTQEFVQNLIAQTDSKPKIILGQFILYAGKAEITSEFRAWILKIFNETDQSIWNQVEPELIFKLARHPQQDLQLFGILQILNRGDKLPSYDVLATVADADSGVIRQQLLQLLRQMNALTESPDALLPILESDFDDLYRGAIQIFEDCPASMEKKVFAAESFAHSPVVRVQAYGMDLLDRFFTEGLPDDILIRLIEHPSNVVRTRIAHHLGNLVKEVIDQIPDLAVQTSHELLKQYFRTILFTPHRGRAAKNKVIELVGKLALSNTSLASWAKAQLHEMTLSNVKRDRTRAFLQLAKVEEMTKET